MIDDDLWGSCPGVCPFYGKWCDDRCFACINDGCWYTENGVDAL